MSGARLIRALERGGAAFVSADGSIAVRRSADARATIIGRMEAEAFAALRDGEHLKRLGDAEPARFVWCGAKLSSTRPVHPSAQGFMETRAERRKTMLGHVLLTLRDESEAGDLRRVVKWFREDVMWADRAGPVAGMNWSDLALGGRVDRSRGAASSDDPLYRVAAKRRLKQVRASLGARGFEQVYELVVEPVSRQRFQRNYDYTRKDAEARAVGLLRRLSWLYEKAMKPPSGITDG